MGIDEYMGTDDLMAIEETANNRNQETNGMEHEFTWCNHPSQFTSSEKQQT